MKRWAVILGVSVAMAMPAVAEIKVPAKVRYATQDGESQWQPTNVTFITGSELNAATSSIKFNSFKRYAVVFFSQTQAAVIKSEQLIICGEIFDSSCLPSIGNFKGGDESGREWEICTTMLC